MILNVNFDIFDLDNKLLPKKANKYLANILMNAKGDRLKMYELSLKVNENETIEVDTADLKLIETAVNETQMCNNLISGAILKEIEAQKITSKEVKNKKSKKFQEEDHV